MSAWDPAQIYRLGELVTTGSTTWTCSQDYNYNNAPSPASTWWTEVVSPTPSGGFEYVGGLTFSWPAVPAVGGTTVTTQTLIDASLLTPGSTYLIIGSAWMAAYDTTPLTVPHRLVWEPGMDMFQVSIATPSSTQPTVDIATMSSFYNARGFVGEAYDYPFQLLIATDGNPIGGNLAIEVEIKNASGTVSYGNASNVDAFVYKVA